MTIDFKKICELKRELNELLESRPEMKPYQKFIEKEMDKAGSNPHNRMAVLENLLREKQRELCNLWSQAQQECKNLKRVLPKVDKDE